MLNTKRVSFAIIGLLIGTTVSAQTEPQVSAVNSAPKPGPEGKDPGTACPSMYSTIVKMSDHTIPGPKKYGFFKFSRSRENFGELIEPLAVSVESDGKKAILVAPEGKQLTELSLSEAEQMWGPSREVVSQSEYVQSQGFRMPADRVWKWFANSKSACFTRFDLKSRDKNLVLVEAFFESRHSEATKATPKLVKYRALIYGVGSTGWVDL